MPGSSASRRRLRGRLGRHDKPVTLGERQTGAAAALPIWQTFFARVIEDIKKKAEADGLVDFQPADFEVPPNLVFIEIDRKPAAGDPICRYPFMEVFFPGSEPTGSARSPTPQDPGLLLGRKSDRGRMTKKKEAPLPNRP